TKHRNTHALLNQPDAASAPFLVGHNALFFQCGDMIGSRLRALVPKPLADFSVCGGRFAVLTALLKETPDRFLPNCELRVHAIQAYSIAVPHPDAIRTSAQRLRNASRRK